MVVPVRRIRNGHFLLDTRFDESPSRWGRRMGGLAGGILGSAVLLALWPNGFARPRGTLCSNTFSNTLIMDMAWSAGCPFRQQKSSKVIAILDGISEARSRDTITGAIASLSALKYNEALRRSLWRGFVTENGVVEKVLPFTGRLRSRLRSWLSNDHRLFLRLLRSRSFDFCFLRSFQFFW